MYYINYSRGGPCVRPEGEETMKEKIEMKNNAGVGLDRPAKGITLIALIITIVIMLILVAVSINVLIQSNLIGAAKKNRTRL